MGRDADVAMTRFEVPDREDLPEDVAARLDAEAERSGFLPNIFAALSYRPEHFRAFFDYWSAFVDADTLTRAEVEMLVVTVSGVNDCYYCNVAHGALLRVFSRDPDLADQLFTDYRTADLNERHELMCALAVTLTESPGSIEDADLDRLREAGFTDDELWNVGSLTAYVNLTNRLENFADIRPNPEFRTMGRGTD